MQPETKTIITLSAVGAMIGIGQLLVGGEKITLRLAVGRAIVAGGLGLAASAILTILPTLSFPAQVGLAASIASLGTTYLERLFQRIISK